MNAALGVPGSTMRAMGRANGIVGVATVESVAVHSNGVRRRGRDCQERNADRQEAYPSSQ